MLRSRLLDAVLLAAVLAVGLTLVTASGPDPDVHECPPGCTGAPVASAVS
jgi:hypothetical protein